MADPASTSSTYQVDFEPPGKQVEVPANATLLEAAKQAGLALTSSCGGAGRCGQCQVVIAAGSVSPPTSDERNVLTELNLQRGLRLACSTHVQGDVRVSIPESTLGAGQRLQLEGELGKLTLDPLIHACDVEVPAPTMQDPRSDLERLAGGIPPIPGHTIGADPAVVRQIAAAARASDWHLTAFVRGAEIVGVDSAGSPAVGLAVDLGTTKIAASLVGLKDGQELALAGVLNPQIAYGEDVITRLVHACRDADGGHKLASVVREALDDLLGELTERAGVSRTQVADVCIVGNTAMTHLLAELPVRQLAGSPYVAATGDAIDVKAGDLDLTTAPGAYVHVLPCIGGFVGADHVAMILASRLDQTDHVALGIDIGTNTEICLAKPDGSLTSVSCASGPAFEGAHISGGMRAASGAIEAIELTSTGLSLKTVDDAPPIGLCGSGILDGVAELRRWHLINERGRFDQRHKRVREGQSGAEFLLVPADESGSRCDVAITQSDINQVQLAKGAIRAGLEVLLESTDTALEEVEEVIIAGAFGSFLRVQSALDMGLLPRLPNARYRQVGNAALVGARWALVSGQARTRAQQIASHSSYLELTTYPKFKRRFALAMLFPSVDAQQG